MWIHPSIPPFGILSFSLVSRLLTWACGRKHYSSLYIKRARSSSSSWSTNHTSNPHLLPIQGLSQQILPRALKRRYFTISWEWMSTLAPLSRDLSRFLLHRFPVRPSVVRFARERTTLSAVTTGADWDPIYWMARPVWWSDKIRRVLLWFEIAARWRLFKGMSDGLD